jgi:hypothetical protein
MFRGSPYVLQPTVELHRVTISFAGLSFVSIDPISHGAQMLINISETVRHAKYLYSHIRIGIFGQFSHDVPLTLRVRLHASIFNGD